MPYRFLIKDVAPQRLVLRRARADAFDWGATLSDLLAGVWQFLNQHESVTGGPAMARFHEIDASTLEIEAGFPVAEPVQPSGDVFIDDLPACRAATTLHEGPYERLPEAHTSLAEWIAEQSLGTHGPPSPS